MIVDSPGVGESDVMNEFVLSYLPHAFSFIYVIKSSNAGGVQEDRVRRHFHTLTKGYKGGLSFFSNKTHQKYFAVVFVGWL